jgi:hypothetical protein
MDALIKAMEKRDYKISVPNEQYHRGTLVEAMGRHFQIRLREHTKRQAHEPTEKERQEITKYPHSHFVPTWDYVPSNQLSLELLGQYGYSIHAIRDGQKRRIEESLSKIPMAILRSIDNAKRQASIAAEKARVQAEIDRQKREEEERRQLEERRRKEEQARVEALFAEAARWARCRELREYLDAIQGLVNEHYNIVEPDSPLDRWLKWADEAAERSDPLVALRKKIDSSLGVSPEEETAVASAPKPR